MKNFTFLSVLMMSLLFSCSHEQKEEIKTASALGLSQGITSFLNENEIIVCDDTAVLYEYVENKTCEALKADCGSRVGRLSTKGAIAQFACKTALKIVMPILLPSRHLPEELKNSNCRMIKVDELTSDYLPKICDKL